MLQQTPRFYAIDSAKGVGIILVVFGHAWRGAMGAGVLPDGALFRVIDTAIYAFHMPLFFFLSGLMFLQTLRKHPAGMLLRNRVARLLWPMVLWSWLFFGLKYLAGGAANTPVVLADFPLIPLPPYEHLWFLWALFLCHALVILVFTTPMQHLSDRTLRISAVGGAVLLAMLNPFLSVPSTIWGAMVAHLPYFLLGGGVAQFALAKRFDWVGLVCGLAFICLLLLLGPTQPSVLVSLILVVLAWLAWPNIDNGSDTAGWMIAGLRYFGEASMAIFLCHTTFSAGLRILLFKLGLDGLAVVLIATTLIGLLAPLAVLWGARGIKGRRAAGVRAALSLA